VRAGGPQRGCVLLAASLVIALVDFPVAAETGTRRGGDALAAHAPVLGASGIYEMRPPDTGWTRVLPGTIEAGTDLEVLGPGNSWAIVFVNCPRLQMDEVVDYRRNAMRGDADAFSFSEERVMLPDSLVPISYAHYGRTLKRSGDPEIWQVATVVAQYASIEVIAFAGSDSEREAAVAGMLQSLQLTERADTPCGAS
jgi:hypothetical protein